MANPGMPNPEPGPGGLIPGDLPSPIEPEDLPDLGPTVPDTPYPVDDPDYPVADPELENPMQPEPEPDYLPGDPDDLDLSF